MIVADDEFALNGLEYEAGERVKLAPDQELDGVTENSLGESVVLIRSVENVGTEEEPDEIERIVRIPAHIEEE